jgi:hypothetical protein
MLPGTLAQLPIRGAFEAHLTVDAATPERRAAFATVCDALGVTCVLIELARGAHPSQPMTSSHHAGELATVIAEVDALHARLVAAGFGVARVKLEALATNPGVPVADADVHAGAYFEFHVKLALPHDAALDDVRAIAIRHGAHLSRNDRRREAGLAHRFVTLRVHGAGRDRATRALDALIADLAAYRIAGVEREYTIFDGCAELDAGWLP